MRMVLLLVMMMMIMIMIMTTKGKYINPNFRVGRPVNSYPHVP